MRIVVTNQGKSEIQDLQKDWNSIKHDRFKEKQKVFDRITDNMKKKKLIERFQKSSFNKYIIKKNILQEKKREGSPQNTSLTPRNHSNISAKDNYFPTHNKSKLSTNKHLMIDDKSYRTNTPSNLSSNNLHNHNNSMYSQSKNQTNNNLILVKNNITMNNTLGNNFNMQNMKTHENENILQTENNIDPSSIHMVKVKQKKFYIPKPIQEKYNISKENAQEDSIIMPSLPPELTTSNKLYSKDGKKKQYINVKDILAQETIDALKNQKLRAKKVKELNTVINMSNIRTNYAEKDVLVELDEKLDVEIDLNKINLIKYLHSKDKVSDKFIKQFDTFSDEKLNKLNKICQILYHNNEKEKLSKDFIKEKLQNNLNKVKINYKSIIDDVENGIVFSKAILKTYNNKVNKLAIYGDLYRETKKHWEKTNVEKLERRTFKPTPYPSNEVGGVSSKNSTQGVVMNKNNNPVFGKTFYSNTTNYDTISKEKTSSKLPLVNQQTTYNNSFLKKPFTPLNYLENNSSSRRNDQIRK